MIKIENLKKQFGDTVACNIDQFVINDGDILGLVGNNGAGKTTLFRMLLDLLKPDAIQPNPRHGSNKSVPISMRASSSISSHLRSISPSLARFLV